MSKLGLVFGGGGARGAAHIGVHKVLEEKGIKVDPITKCSIIAIISGLHSNFNPIYSQICALRRDSG